MSVNCREVLEPALQLSAEDRGTIAERLLETLSAEDAELGGDELVGELERPLERAENDRWGTVPWTALREDQ